MAAWLSRRSDKTARSCRVGVPPEQAEKIHTVLQKFVKLAAVVATKIMSMKSAEAQRYLDGGG